MAHWTNGPAAEATSVDFSDNRPRLEQPLSRQRPAKPLPRVQPRRGQIRMLSIDPSTGQEMVEVVALAK